MNRLKLHPVLLTLSLAAQGQVQAAPQVPVSAQQSVAFGIELEAPQRVSEVLTRRYPAKVGVPNHQLRVVSAPQSGVVESLSVAEGEPLQAGQELARLLSPELLELQSAYLEVLTRRDLARNQSERDRKLHAEGLIAERRLLESRAAHRELATSAAQRRQRLALAGMSEGDIRQLARSRSLSSSLALRAPIDGVVLEQMVDTGQAVSAAEPLYRIGDLSPLWLEIHVPVDRVGRISTGDRVHLPNQSLEARVITVGRMVHKTDQGVLVRAEIRDGAQLLRPGQFVEAQLAEATAEQAWRVADSAVMRNAGQAYVFAAREQGFDALPVRILNQGERHLVIQGKLTPQDRLAVSGIAALKAAWLGGAE